MPTFGPCRGGKSRRCRPYATALVHRISDDETPLSCCAVVSNHRLHAGI